MDILTGKFERTGGIRDAFAFPLAVLDAIAAWAIVGLLSAMVLVVSTQVLLRYGVNGSIGWADEVSRLCFVWTIFLAIPLGIRSGVHIGIELVTERLPPLLRIPLARMVAVIGAAMMALVAWQSLLLALDQRDEMMSSLSWSSSWFIVPLALGCGHAMLHLIRLALFGPSRPDTALLEDLS
jgi:TRAP-type transport system small permease protein